MVCLGGAGTAWGAERVKNARDHLQDAATLVRELRQQVQRSDPAAAHTLIELQRATRAARSESGDPSWRLGAHLPVVGDDLAAVRSVAAVLDDLAHDGLPPLVETAGMVDVGALAPIDGQIDLAPLQRAAPRLSAASTAIGRARDQVAGISVEGLIGPLRSAVEQLRSDLRQAAATAATAARSAALLPPALGQSGPRTYLVLFQNLAEVRATGGMPGAFVVVRADHGKVTIIDQGRAGAWDPFRAPVLKLAASDRALYGDRMGRYLADVNFTPDFSTTGRLAREMYRRYTGRTVDGVLATDPVALSYLLRAIGPVSVPDGPDLTAANAVPILLSRIYTDGSVPTEQDQYFAAAAASVFQALVQHPRDPSRMLAELAKATGERRILVWSAKPAENKLLAGTMLAGVLPPSDGRRPTVGVFLNDGSGAKLGYYLRHSADLAVVDGCRGDGRRELTLRVSLGSTAPRSGLSPYVLGLGLAGDPYTLRTMVSIYSSTGGTVVSMKLDGTAASFGSGKDRRRAVGRIAVDLKPGTTRTLDVALLTGVPGNGAESAVVPQLRTTPGITAWSGSVRTADACSNRR
jgi:hypothetical protein